MVHEITVALGRHGWVLGAPRPEAAAAGPYRAALPRARAPPADFSL